MSTERIRKQMRLGRPIGDIATNLPGATGLFRKYRLDFCCGGDQRLKDAAAQRGADLPAIEKELPGFKNAGRARTE